MGRKSREKQLRKIDREKQRPLHRGPQAIREFGFEITTEPLEADPLPPDIADQADELFSDSIDHPDRGIPRLEELIEKHPDAPTLKNWLSAAYASVGRKDDAERIIRRTFSEHPNYLFAKISYAEMCLGAGRADEVPALFGGKTELNQIITDRNLFHITEFTSFYFVMAKHALLTGDLEATNRYWRKLHRAAPDSQATRVLQELIATCFTAAAQKLQRAPFKSRPVTSRPYLR